MEVRVTPERQEKNRIAKTLTAALYEAGVKCVTTRTRRQERQIEFGTGVSS